MRRDNTTPAKLWGSINVEDLIEPDHPLRAIKRLVDEALTCPR